MNAKNKELIKKIIISNSKASSDMLLDATKESKTILDEYNKRLEENKVEPFKDYGLNSNTLNWTLFTALYSKSWVLKRAIDKPAEDMVKCGISLDLDSNKKDIKDKIYNKLKQDRNKFIKLIKMGRLYGGAIIVIMPSNYIDDSDYLKSLDSNINKIKKAKKLNLYVADRWYGLEWSNETVTDAASCDYGKPEFYRITFPNGHSFKVHHSYVLRYEGREAPDFIKYGELRGWGYSECSHILNELSRDDQLKYAITQLINKSLIEVIKMPGMRGLYRGEDEESQRELESRLEDVAYARDFNSLTLLDTDDEYEQNQFSGLSGLSDLLEINMWLIAAALEMSGVLYGDLKNGFSNDEEALERYDETILNLNETYFRDILTKYLSVLYKINGVDEEVSFEFNSLLTKKKDKERVEALKNFQELLSGMLTDGVINTKLYAKAMRNYTLNNQIDFELTDEYINELEDKMEEEMEQIEFTEPEEGLDKIKTL